jgi:hypothetical protein
MGSIKEHQLKLFYLYKVVRHLCLGADFQDLSEVMKVFKSSLICPLIFLVLLLNFSLVFFTPSNDDQYVNHIKVNHVSVISSPHELHLTSSINGSYNNATIQAWIKVFTIQP